MFWIMLKSNRPKNLTPILFQMVAIHLLLRQLGRQNSNIRCPLQHYALYGTHTVFQFGFGFSGYLKFCLCFLLKCRVRQVNSNCKESWKWLLTMCLACIRKSSTIRWKRWNSFNPIWKRSSRQRMFSVPPLRKFSTKMGPLITTSFRGK